MQKIVKKTSYKTNIRLLLNFQNLESEDTTEYMNSIVYVDYPQEI